MRASDTSITGDEQLVSATLTGSHEAFGMLVERYARTVRALCIARLGLSPDLDDLVQDVFVRAYQGLGRLASKSAFCGYLRTIATNLCIDRIRRRRTGAMSLDQVDLEPQAPEPDAEDERLQRLRRLLGALPEGLREALLLFYFEERSVAEIATQLGLTEAAIHQRLHRARTQLREAFDVRREGAS